mgnify:CR=1 FL=1
MKKANSAVASVSTSAVFVNGILYSLASERLMLSKPTAIWATTLSESFPRCENLGVNRIAESRDQRVDPALHFLDDQFFRRRFRALENFEIIAALAQPVSSRLADAGSSEDAKGFLVSHGWRHGSTCFAPLQFR